MRRGARMTVAAVAVVTLAGCGVRLETPEPTWPSPDAVTLERDALALREHHIIQRFDSSADPSNSTLALEGVMARTAPAHLDALGGVYRAYDDDELPAFDGSLTDAALEARNGAWETALRTDDADLGSLAASIALSHSVSLWFAGWVDASAVVNTEEVEERPLPPIDGADSPPLVPEATALDGETLMELAVLHDQARYLYETIGARSQDEARDLAYVRMDIHRERSDALAALARVDDRRESIYSVVAADITGPEAQADAARAMETAVAGTYAALLVSETASERPWLASGAFDAYAAAATLPGFTADQLPVLPGLDVS